MDIKRDVFRARRPILVAETVDMLAVVLGIEGMVAGGHGGVVDDVRICGIHDLHEQTHRG